MSVRILACVCLAGTSLWGAMTLDDLAPANVATNRPAPVAVATNRHASAVVATNKVVVAPVNGWTWDELAARASERADSVKLALLQTAAKQQSVQDKLAWRDPQLRIGRTWEDSRDRGSGRPENGDGDTYTLGVRFYVSNPFVNHYLQRVGDSQVAALHANARAEAYAIACEVRSLCLEENRLARELKHQEDTARLWSRVRECLARRLEQGVEKSPITALKAEISGEKVSMGATELQLKLRQVRRQIAFLTGVPERQLKIRYTPPEPPSTNKTCVTAFTESAFVRRPDLTCALIEYNAAQAGVKAAAAKNIPWFEFVEGTYSHGTDSRVDWSGSGVRGHRSGSSDDWQVRVGITIPVFTWFGDSVKVARLVEEAADVRVQALVAGVRNEVAAAFDDFLVADERFVRLSNNKQFLAKMESRIREFSSAATVRPDDVCRAQMELIDYRRLRDRIEYEWVRRILLLETVTGGPLRLER